MSEFICNDCNSRFGGYNTCHCSACHRTFTSIEVSDKHRFRGKCLNPGEILDKNGERMLRLSDREYPCWTFAKE